MNAKRCIANVLGVVAFSLVSLTFPCGGHADAGEYTADFIVCKKKVEGVYFYYGFIDQRWQALQDFAIDFEVEDCDVYYQIPAKKIPLA